MFQQIAEDVTEETVSSPRVQRLSRPLTRIIYADLRARLVTFSAHQKSDINHSR